MTTDDPLIGHVLAHYRVVARLGTGVMGVVYRAEDIRLHRGVGTGPKIDPAMAEAHASLGDARLFFDRD